MRATIAIFCLVLALSFAATAEIQKQANTCNSGICFYWWPKLPAVPGWHQDQTQSFHYNMNALAPDGFTFANAQTVMYVEAIYKPRMPEAKTVDMLIAGDEKSFLAKDPTISVTKAASLSTGDGQELPTFTFFPKAQGNWEEVAYGEEGDFYLIFTLSSRRPARSIRCGCPNRRHQVLGTMPRPASPGLHLLLPRRSRCPSVWRCPGFADRTRSRAPGGAKKCRQESE